MATSLIHKITKPKTQRGKRALEGRAPKLIENDKRTLFIKGGCTSQTVTSALSNFNSLKKPLCYQLKQKNPVKPFDDAGFIEKMCKKYDCSLFVLGSHSKKRPHNLVLGRLYDFEVLDMYELGIVDFRSMQEFIAEKVPYGTKPSLLFSGEAFEDHEELKQLKNILIDLFRGPTVERLNIRGVEHLIHFTILSESRIAMRSYRVSVANDEDSPEQSGKLKLTEIGPHMDLTVRRCVLPTEDKWKRANRKPLQTFKKQKKKHNVDMDAFGNKLGRVHVTRQDMEALHITRVRALKRKGKEVRNVESTVNPSTKKSRVSSD